jgi:hypothetical protein
VDGWVIASRTWTTAWTDVRPLTNGHSLDGHPASDHADGHPTEASLLADLLASSQAELGRTAAAAAMWQARAEHWQALAEHACRCLQNRVRTAPQ